MKPWMLAVMSGAPQLVPKTYTSSQTVTIPLGVSRLETLVGKGGPGSPEDTVWVDKYEITRVESRRRRSDGVAIAYGSPVISTGYGETPGSYCESQADHTPLPNDPVYSEKWYCYYYRDTSEWRTTSATTGASTTGFDKTFPGGYGGPASPVTHSNVPVTPGKAYPLVIPAGGSITISYYL